MIGLYTKTFTWRKGINFFELPEGGEILFINNGEVKIFKINKEGKKIWEMCNKSYTLRQILNSVDLYKKEVKEFISFLQKENLITLYKAVSSIENQIRLIKLKNPPSIKFIRKEKLTTLSNDFYYLTKGLIKTQLFIPKVNLEITSKCNLRCKHCYILDSSNINDSDKFKIIEIINKLKKSNVQILNLTGGEPFVEKWVFEIINYAHNKGLELIINTNGTLLNNNIIEKIKRISPRIFFNVSLDGNRTIHDIIRGRRTFTKVITNIKLLKDKGFPMRINYVVNKKNLLYTPFIYLKANKWKIEDFIIIPLRRIGKAKKNKNLHLNFINWIVLLFMVKFIKFLKKKFKFYTNFDIIRCATFTYLHIDKDGNIHYCDQIPKTMMLGNIFETSLLEIWHSQRYKELFQKDNIKPPCKFCKYKENCQVDCRAEVYSLTGDFFAGNPMYPFCKILNKISLFLHI